MSPYYILIREQIDGHYGRRFRNVYVKEGEFFEIQGGLTEEWGKNWIKVMAEGIEHARIIGEHMKIE